jgi:hypothetical protein
MRPPLLAFALLAALISISPVSAIIIKQAPGRNLVAPAGEFAGRGWEFTGQWGGFLGTPIAPHYFVTAKHLGGVVGQKLLYRGKYYTSVETFPCPDSDLAIWRVAEAFPAWAPLYTGNQEIGKTVFLTGCGTARGAPVRTTQGKLCGWRWGADDHRQSWGMNRISSTLVYTQPKAQWKNEILSIAFDQDGSPQEGIVSGSDSGGPIFLHDTDGTWKLAGIIYGVDSTPFSTNASGKDAVNAALFDARGLYEKDRHTGEMHYHDPKRPNPEPTMAGATRISSSLPFIHSVVPELRPFPILQIATGASVLVFAISAFWLIRRRISARQRRRKQYSV